MKAELLLPLCLHTLKEAENALSDYINTIEKQGATLNYRHRVMKQIKAVIELLQAN